MIGQQADTSGLEPTIWCIAENIKTEDIGVSPCPPFFRRSENLEDRLPIQNR